MGSPFAGVGQVAEILHPKTLKQKMRAGALGLKTPLATTLTLPWLLGRGPSMGILSAMNAITIGAKPAIHDRNGTITWCSLDARVNRVAHAMESIGLNPGDHVTLLLRNGRECAEVALAAQRLGPVACPLNTWAKPKELEATIRNARPLVLFYDTAHAEAVARCAPPNVPLVAVGDMDVALDGSVSYEELIGEHGTHPPGPFVRHLVQARNFLELRFPPNHLSDEITDWLDEVWS